MWVFILDLQCPHHNNPADFVIDKIIDHEQETDVAHSKAMVIMWSMIAVSCDLTIASNDVVITSHDITMTIINHNSDWKCVINF